MDQRPATDPGGFVAQGVDAVIAKVHELGDMFG
jgi:hypothetical protein